MGFFVRREIAMDVLVRMAGEHQVRDAGRAEHLGSQA